MKGKDDPNLRVNFQNQDAKFQAQQAPIWFSFWTFYPNIISLSEPNFRAFNRNLLPYLYSTVTWRVRLERSDWTSSSRSRISSSPASSALPFPSIFLTDEEENNFFPLRGFELRFPPSFLKSLLFPRLLWALDSSLSGLLPNLAALASFLCIPLSLMFEFLLQVCLKAGFIFFKLFYFISLINLRTD